MNGHRFGVGRLAAGLLAALWASGALAQNTPPASPPAMEKPPVDRPAAKPAPAAEPEVSISTEARAVLEKELRIVRGLQSVKGTAQTHWQDDIEGKPPIKDDLTLEYALEKPNRLFIETRVVRVYADGNTATVYSKPLKQYVQRPMPEVRQLREALEKISGGQIRSIPGEALLRPGMELEQTLRNIRTVEGVKTGDLDGRAGVWVSGTAIDDRSPGSIPFTFERFYADDDHMLACIRQDYTAMYQDMVDKAAAEETETIEESWMERFRIAEAKARKEGKLMEIEPTPTPKKADKFVKVGMTTVYKRDLNPDLPAGTFTFVPAEGDRRVESFLSWTPGIKEQLAMIGQPAPALEGNDLDGKPVDVASLKGKIVVLDFWATWCGPCVAGLPSMQMIKEKYADKPFTMIGVNEEALNHAPATEDGAKAKRFLERRKINIPQLLDSDRAVAKAYFVSSSAGSSIPVAVIIDAAGNVADIEGGYTPGKEKELMAKIDRLLAGRSVYTAEELAKRREQVQGAN